MASPIDVLLIEDNEVDARDVARMLRAVPEVPTRLTHVDSLTAGLDQLSGGPAFAVVLLDLGLPESHGLPTLDRVRAAAPAPAIVVLTGEDDRQTGFAAVQHGAQDYLIKGKVDAELLVRSLTYAIERQRLHSQMSRLMDELRRSNRELEQFAYVVAHDLKAPLRTIIGFCNLLGRGDSSHLSEEEKEFLGYVLEGGNRMSAIIDDLLRYSRVRLEEGVPEPVDLADVFDRAIANLQDSVERSGAQISRDPLPVLPVDAAQICQLFQNLIGNAIKFRRDEPPCVWVSAAERSQEWEFSVRDNGIGIPDAQHERVFQVFQRLHGEREYEGTGIGLAICKKVVEVHGGRIWINSAEGQGSEFCFTLPKHPPQEV